MILKTSLFRGKRAASLTGYGLIVGLIAITAIVALRGVGENVNTLFEGVAAQLSLSADSGGGSGEVSEPEILSITASGGPYLLGQTITIILDASEDLISSGSPSLGLDIGGISREATLGTVSAGNVQFSYTVQAGDHDMDGIEVNQLNFAAGELTNNDSQSLDVSSFALPVNLGIFVDSCPDEGDLCADGTYFAGLGPDSSGGSARLYTTRCDSGQSYDEFSTQCVCDNPMISEPTSTSPNNRVLSPAASSLGCSSSYHQGGLGPATVSRSIITWNNGATDNDGPVTSVSDVNTGRQNTQILVTDVGTGNPFGAAQFCDNLVLHGYGDWYLPARAEFDVLVSTQSLGGGFGASFNTSSAQIEGRYWTSTQDGSDFPYNYKFSNSSWNASPGVLVFYVRCVRR